MTTPATTSANGLILQSTIDQINQINVGDNTNAVQNTLNDIRSNLVATDNDILTKQSNVLDILNNEKARLDLKKQSIDSAISSRERLVQMNDNYVKRNYQYIKMFVAIMLILFTLLLLNVLDANIYIFVPVISLVSISSICYCIYTYRNLSIRSLSNYDELVLEKPVMKTKTDDGTTTAPTPTTATTVTDVNGKDCYKQDCCGVGTVWDGSNNICVPATSVDSNNGVD